MPTPKSEKVPEAMRPHYDAIVALIEPVCREYLSEDYATLARQLTAALARKRPSPLVRGRSDIWACAIIYALGSVNFLFDPSQDPHMRADELCAAFGVSQSSGANKAKQIRDLFGMYQLDPQWCLPGKVDSNPWIWLLQINGLIVDVRQMPREIQETAFRKGLIPYIPADSGKEHDGSS